MQVKTVILQFDKTENGVQVLDITRQVEHSIVDSFLKDGIATVHVSSPELSISTMEYEPGSVKDLKDALEKFVHNNGNNGNSHADGKSKSKIYAYGLGGVGTAVSYRERAGLHDKKDMGKNSDVMHVIMGPSITVPVKDNRMLLGKWQEIVLIDIGKKERKKVTLQIIGEFGSDRGGLDN